MARYRVNCKLRIVYIIRQLIVFSTIPRHKDEKVKKKNYIKTTDIYGVTEYTNLDQIKRACKFILNILLHNYIFYILNNT